MAGLANTDRLLDPSYEHNHLAASAARNYKYKKEADNGAHPKGTSEWFLLSVGQWEKMVIAARGCKNLQNNASLDTQDGYHSSTEAGDGRAWYFKSHDGVSVYLRLPKRASQLRVRPALAF